MSNRLSLIFIFMLPVVGCSIKNLSADTATDTRLSPNSSLFPLIAAKSHGPKGLPAAIGDAKLMDRAEAKGIVPDSLMTDGDSYYLSDEKFLTVDPKDTKFIVYYRKHDHNKIEKRLHAEISGTISDLRLAMYRDNGSDSDALGTEFVTDTLFRERKKHSESVSEERELQVLRCDSVISTYSYTPTLKLRLQQRDSIRFFEERHLSGGIVTQIAKTMRSENITVNGMACYWNFITATGSGVGALPPGRVHFTMQLVTSSSGKVLLESTDMADAENIDTQGLRMENFKDINFDGYDDFINYSWQHSGSGGAFYNAWLYNPKKKMFEYSKELSGGELQADAETRTLSLYWKSGYPSNSTRIIHFGDKGKIKYTEDVTRELVPGTPTARMITTYQKKIGKKIVSKTIDTTAIQQH